MPAGSFGAGATNGVASDLQCSRQRATVQRIELNGWGVVRILHTFTWLRLDDPQNGRDWIVTWARVGAMDATAVALVLMVLSSLIIWLETPQKRKRGAVALSLGLLSCGLFCLGLRWLY